MKLREFGNTHKMVSEIGVVVPNGQINLIKMRHLKY